MREVLPDFAPTPFPRWEPHGEAFPVVREAYPPARQLELALASLPGLDRVARRCAALGAAGRGLALHYFAQSLDAALGRAARASAASVAA